RTLDEVLERLGDRQGRRAGRGATGAVQAQAYRGRRVRDVLVDVRVGEAGQRERAPLDEYLGLGAGAAEDAYPFEYPCGEVEFGDGGHAAASAEESTSAVVIRAPRPVPPGSGPAPPDARCGPPGRAAPCRSWACPTPRSPTRACPSSARSAAR